MRSIWGAVFLIGCGGSDGAGLFADDLATPVAVERGAGQSMPDAAPTRPAEPPPEADAGSGGAPGAKGSGGQTVRPAAGGAAVIAPVDAGNGGAIGSGGSPGAGGKIGSGGRVASGGSLGAGGSMAGAGGKACSAVTHCVYPRLSDGCPCDNICPAACATSTTIERLPAINGGTGEQLNCAGSCVANVARDCCVPTVGPCSDSNTLATTTSCPKPSDPHKVAACRNWECVEVCQAGYVCP